MSLFWNIGSFTVSYKGPYFESHNYFLLIYLNIKFYDNIANKSRKQKFDLPWMNLTIDILIL